MFHNLGLSQLGTVKGQVLGNKGGEVKTVWQTEPGKLVRTGSEAYTMVNNTKQIMCKRKDVAGLSGSFNVDVTLAEQGVSFLVDTGSVVTIVYYKVFNKLKDSEHGKIRDCPKVYAVGYNHTFSH